MCLRSERHDGARHASVARRYHYLPAVHEKEIIIIMEKRFDYESIWEQALQRIKSVRDPHPERPESEDLGWNVVREQALFNFGGVEFERYTRVITAAKTISLSALNSIIIFLTRLYGLELQPIPDRPNVAKRSAVEFAFVDKANDCLLLFKEIEETNFWQLKGKEPEIINDVLNKYGVSSCKYVFLMLDYAYLQVIGHNDDESDPGRGYNIFSIKWFFETYFGEEEYVRFHDSLVHYLNAVKEYLGYIIVRSLTPTALINFKKITENKLITHDHKELLSSSLKGYNLTQAEYEKLRNQFIGRQLYSILLCKKDYAESLITAEWLYDSMKKVHAIDLTTIVTGYFKSLEQLLFALICLNKNKGLQIRRDPSRKDLPSSVPLDDEHIDGNAIDTTLNSMAVFVKNNIDVMRKDIHYKTKKYVRESIFNYAGLRNGYLHKHNILSWDIIDKIRNATYNLLFLLLGSFSLDEESAVVLGFDQKNCRSDYEMLCEYVNYHASDLFFLDLGYEEDQLAFACADMHSRVIDTGEVEYSGVYFKEFDKDGRIFLFREEHLPKTIYLAKFTYKQTELCDVEPERIKKVFENGRFVGPSIVDEDLRY